MEDTWGDPWMDEDFAQKILDKITILDILNKYEEDYTRISAGNFGYRLRCPFSEHSGGNERTASLYVSEDEKSFHCFGCNAGNNIVDFIMLYKNTAYYNALKILYEVFDLDNVDLSGPVERKIKKPEETIHFYALRSSIAIRDFIKGRDDKWKKWAKKHFIKIDSMLDLDDSEYERGKKYYERLIKFLESK